MFFYLINDTSVPFLIDQTEQTLQLISPLDREKQEKYSFEIELILKSSYAMKLQEIYQTSSVLKVQYSTKYHQKMLITIYIDDVNDHIPQCDYFHQHLFLHENQIQTNILRVHAVDPDRGINLHFSRILKFFFFCSR